MIGTSMTGNLVVKYNIICIPFIPSSDLFNLSQMIHKQEWSLWDLNWCLLNWWHICLLQYDFFSQKDESLKCLLDKMNNCSHHKKLFFCGMKHDMNIRNRCVQRAYQENELFHKNAQRGSLIMSRTCCAKVFFCLRCADQSVDALES